MPSIDQAEPKATETPDIAEATVPKKAAVTEEASEMSTPPAKTELIDYKRVQSGEISFEIPDGWVKHAETDGEEGRLVSFSEGESFVNPIILLLILPFGDIDYFEMQLITSDDIVMSNDKHTFARSLFPQVAKGDTDQISSAITYENNFYYQFIFSLDEDDPNTKHYGKIFERLIKSVEIQSDKETSSPDPTDHTPIEKSDAIVYSGSGNDVIQIETLPEPWVLHISGNAEERHFAVIGYDENGKSTELFVNTTDRYEGTTADLYLETEILEISASGAWTIEVRSIYDQAVIQKGETYSGRGDDILLIYSSGATASIKGNSDERYFAVRSYGDSNELLVNTTEAYDGKVMLKGDPYLLEVSAHGSWTFTLD